jgi:hypothetical protein
MKEGGRRRTAAARKKKDIKMSGGRIRTPLGQNVFRPTKRQQLQ